MKWLKTEEEKELLKLKKEAAEKQQQINKIEELERQRKKVLDRADSEFGAKMQNYRNRCEQYAVDQDAIIRVILMCHERDVRRMTPNDWPDLIASYNLQEFGKWINALCPKEAPPQRKKVDPLESWTPSEAY